MAEATQRELDEVQAAMAAREFDKALRLLDEVLDASPDHGDALYFKAVCLRYLKKFTEAEAALTLLLDRFPSNGRGHQERGHWFRDQQRLEDALGAYTQACQHNPALVASFKARVAILRHLSREAEAVQVFNQWRHLEQLPKPLLAVMDLIHQGKLLRAEDLCRNFLAKAPRDVEAMRLLADIGVRLGVMDDAEFLLESAVTFAPDNLAARVDYVQVLRRRQRFEQALEQSRVLLTQGPENPQFQSMYAVISMQAGDYEEALRYFDLILERLPGDAGTLTSKGHALKTRGDFDAAVYSYQQAYGAKPDHGEAYYSLSNLKTYRFTEDELTRMHALTTDQRMGASDRIYLDFALGKAYEDQGNYQRAFEFYRAGNRLKKIESKYDATQMHADLGAQARVCTREFFAERRGHGNAAPDPIFIVGLPRAGSTLLEQILSSHSQVDGTLELPNILSLSHRLRRMARHEPNTLGYPEVLRDLAPEQLKEFGDEFLSDTQIHRQGAPFFIDKMPNNFRHIGLIKLILPNAKIIDARRDPMACCFSGYKQLFAEGQEFSYDLEDIGRYYRDYVALMTHWDAALPDEVLLVKHEEVVEDLEGQVRRMLAYCGLPFEEACLRYYETERNVRTPSSEQVRQPIFTDSIEQWRHFEPWLGPLKDALGDLV